MDGVVGGGEMDVFGGAKGWVLRVPWVPWVPWVAWIPRVLGVSGVLWILWILWLGPKEGRGRKTHAWFQIVN